MNDATETEVDDEPSRPLTAIEIFFIKVATVTGAILLLMFAAYLFVSSQADEPDLPEPKKAKIIAALRKISDRYRPYLDAVEGTPGK